MRAPNLTDKQLEMACRFLCKFRKQDPDALIGKDDKGCPGFPCWTFHRREILSRHTQLQVETAIKQAIEK